MDRLGIARALGETADLLALTGEEPFRARAYQRGARVLEALSDADFGRLLAEGRLTTLAGIGRGLAVVIGDLARSGRSSALEQVRGERVAQRVGADPELGAALRDVLPDEAVDAPRRQSLSLVVQKERIRGSAT